MITLSSVSGVARQAGSIAAAAVGSAVTRVAALFSRRAPVTASEEGSSSLRDAALPVKAETPLAPRPVVVDLVPSAPPLDPSELRHYPAVPCPPPVSYPALPPQAPKDSEARVSYNYRAGTDQLPLNAQTGLWQRRVVLAEAHYRDNPTRETAEKAYERLFGTLPSARFPGDVIMHNLRTRAQAIIATLSEGS